MHILDRIKFFHCSISFWATKILFFCCSRTSTDTDSTTSSGHDRVPCQNNTHKVFLSQRFKAYTMFMKQRPTMMNDSCAGSWKRTGFQGRWSTLASDPRLISHEKLCCTAVSTNAWGIRMGCQKIWFSFSLTPPLTQTKKWEVVHCHIFCESFFFVCLFFKNCGIENRLFQTTGRTVARPTSS